MRILPALTTLRTLLKLSLFMILTTVTLAGIAYSVKFIIEPGYKDSSSRMYSSRFGYANWVRQHQGEFPVTTALVTERDIEVTFLGEGLVQSEPVQVPVIPIGRISQVHVNEGDQVLKGQLLAELDTTLAVLALEEAEIKLAAVQSEFERTKIGTNYQQVQERPGQANIRLKAAAYEVSVRTELNSMLEKLAGKQLVTRSELLKNRIQRVAAQAKMREARLALDMAEQGHQHSLQIAKAAVRSATIDVEKAKRNLAEHKIIAPADGIVERCVVHVGEFIQSSGKPAFLLASGQWFEAHFDQASIGQIALGDAADVRLEAFAGEIFSGKVTQIRRVISYNQGGPETNRPLRPLGTGAPEWPATYAVRIALEDPKQQIVSGLSGFARAACHRLVPAIPSSAVISVSGRKGMVYLIEGETFKPCEVTVGQNSKGWIEIRSGLSNNSEVIVTGHHILEPGDRIAVESKTNPRSSAESRLAGR